VRTAADQGILDPGLATQLERQVTKAGSILAKGRYDDVRNRVQNIDGTSEIVPGSVISHLPPAAAPGRPSGFTRLHGRWGTSPIRCPPDEKAGTGPGGGGNWSQDTLSAVSSRTKEVWSWESSVPVNFTVMLWPL
jgi:hypothetical protein